MPASQEEHRGHCRGDEDVGVFRQEEEGEPHPGVFGVEAGHQFRFRFREVKGGPVGFGGGADNIENERQGLHRYEPVMALGGDNIGELERPHHEDDTHDGDEQGNFVGDVLGHGADGA